MVRWKAWPALVLLLACDAGGGGGAAGSGTAGTVGGSGGAGAAGGSGGAGAAGGGGSGGGAVPCASCGSYGDAVVAGAVIFAAITEASGLGASRVNPGLLYVHNDSGDSARFFALGPDGSLVAEVSVTGAQARDWEDLAVGPCPQGSCVYLADIGDNNAVRDTVQLYRVPEPQLSPGPEPARVELGAERFDARYPGGPRNAEALLVHPATGEVFIVTKRLGEAEVHRVPLAPAGEVAQTVEVARIALDGRVVTGADVHPCGHRVLLRSYGTIHELSARPGAPFEAVLAAAPAEVPSAGEPQGEAVAYLADGTGFVTLSEGAAQPLHRVSCGP